MEKISCLISWFFEMFYSLKKLICGIFFIYQKHPALKTIFSSKLQCVEKNHIESYLKLSDLAFPGLGTSLALTKWRAPQLH